MDIEDLHRVVVQGFASVSDRFDSVDAQLAGLSRRIETLEDAVRQHSTSIRSLEECLAPREERAVEKSSSRAS
jgi:hypothetical protein